MAVTLVHAPAAQNSGSAAASTVAITPTMPTGIVSGNRAFVFQSHSCESGSASTPSNWTALYKDVAVGTGTAASSSGRRFISCYYRDYDGVWTMPSFALASVANNSHAISALAVLCDPTETFDTPTFSGVATYFGTAGTAFSATLGSAFNATTKAFLMAHAATNDNVTATSGAITGSGFTSGTVTERGDSGTATGNDVSIKLHTCVPTTGANVALTHTMTLSAASEGGWAAVQQTATYGGSTPAGAFMYDTFRDADAVLLENHTGDLGATWAKQTGWTGTYNHAANRVHGLSSTEAHFYSSATPPSADYEVSADVYVVSNIAFTLVGTMGRMNTAANTGYAAFVMFDGSSVCRVYLKKFVAGTGTDLTLGIAVTSPTQFSTHTIALRMQGTTIKSFWDGVEIASVTDSAISATGRAGVMNNGVGSATTGYHLVRAWANPYPNATDYVPSITPEAVGITDSVTKDAGRDATDTVGITDSVTKDVGRTATDLVGVTDSASTVQDWARSQTDLVGVTDSVTTTQDWVRSQTDPVGVTDSAEFSLAYFADATDAVGVTDSVGTVQDWVRTQTDLVGVSDAAAFESGRTAVDAVGIVDSGSFNLVPEWTGPVLAAVGTRLAVASSTAANVPIPAGVAEGDIILVGIGIYGAATLPTITPPAGFTEAASSPGTSTYEANQASVRMFWKRQTAATGAGETTGTYDFVLSAARFRMAHALRFTGGSASGDPFDVTTSAGNGSDSTSFPTVSLTTTVDNTLMVWFGGSWDGFTLTPPTGFTIIAQGPTDNSEAGEYFASKQQATAGSSGSLAGTQAGNNAKAVWLGALEPVGVGTDYTPSETDSVGITDSAAFSLGFSAAATDPVGVSDSVTVQQDWSRSQTDPVGVTDALAKDAGRTATDSVGITDTAATTQDWVRVQTDLVGVTDSYVSGLGRLATDTVGATDSFSVVQAWVRSETDLVGVSDSGSFDLAGAGDVTDTDQVGLSDSLGTAFAAVRSDDDEVGVTDSGLFEVGSVAGADDPVGITDLLAVIAAYEQSWADPVGVADAATFDLSSVGDIVESDLVGVSDVFGLAADYARSFSDPVGVLDDAQFQLDAAADEDVDATDLVGVVDAAFFAMLLPPGPFNTWVVPVESVRHTPKAESVRHAGVAEPVGYALTKETNTYALKAESTHSEVIG